MIGEHILRASIYKPSQLTSRPSNICKHFIVYLLHYSRLVNTRFEFLIFQ